MAVGIMSTIGQTNSRVKLSTSLSSKVRELHAVIYKPATHDESQPISDAEAKRLVLSPCELAGFCVHGAVGRSTVAMRSQMFSALFNVRFPASNPIDRSLFAKGAHIAVLAVAEEHVFEPVEGDPAPLPLVSNHWLHMGAVDLKPREFEAQVLRQRGSETEALSIDAAFGEYEMQGVWEFLDSWIFLQAIGSAAHLVSAFFLRSQKVNADWVPLKLSTALW